MGKKLSTNQASTKISKEDKKKQQHQLNNMFKILRPKVYITHSSDFKRLVQELTGYGDNNYSQINIPAIPPIVQQSPIIDIIEDEDHHHQETTSMDLSVDMSSDNAATHDSPLEAGIIIPEDLDSMLEDICGDDHASLSPPSSSSCDWQLEMMDPFITYNNLHDDFGDPFYNSYNMPTEQALYNQQEVCVFENMELLQW
ncbi:hypothetical protein LIER_09036 [Lithospermum erythrorhizon]|uniref:VQ domain-containing protein n=1 Tax=Lithospermum erythrorhizon TaxID=34254 RepID=A0AAV3PIK2_LITER